MKRKMITALTLLLAFSVILSACGTATEDGKNAAGTAGAASASPASTPAEEQKPAKLRIFYVTQGNTVEDGFDYANNPILNEICKRANVEITEAVVPAWSDVSTKYNLMMSSGNICDVVQSGGDKAGASVINNDGKNGAFMDLTDIINNSEVIKQRYAPYINQLKADDGKIYCLRMLPADGDVNNSFFVRWDVLQDLGYTELPKTLDEWLDAMRAEKKKYPDSIPYTTMDNLHFSEFVFNCYGITGRGNGWQQYFGKAIMQFEHPLYKDALKVYNTMLKEGLMDPEFVTSKRADFDEKRYNRKTLVNQQNLAAAMGFCSRYMTYEIFDARTIPAPWPVVDDPKVDPNSVYEGALAVGNTCAAIASTTKEKDGAVRFIEELLSDNTKELAVWGIENVDYKVENGKKVAIVDDGTRKGLNKSKGIYNMLFAGNTVTNIEKIFNVGIATIKERDPNANDKELEEYTKMSWDQYNKILELNAAQPTRAGFTYFITLEPDTQSRMVEAQAEALTIIIKAMRGDISWDEYDAQAAAFIKKYQFITDEFNAKLPAANEKAKLAN